MEILIRATQFILSLSILVVLHELGHFIPAKLFKTRVEKFYLFFDPWFSLFKFKKGGTEYGIGWLPLGGYVKIAGMIDESMDKEQMSKPAESWEFRAKPTWQRLIIMVGGVTVNLILAIVIYIGVLFTWGQEFLEVRNLPYGVHADSLMQTVGFADGDKLVAINGKELTNEELRKVRNDVLLGRATNITVERAGRRETIALPADLGERILEAGQATLFEERIPFYVDTVLEGKPAAEAGLQKGDRILSVDDTPTAYFKDFQQYVNDRKEGESIHIQVERNGEAIVLPTQVTTNELGKGVIGVGPRSPADMLDQFTITKVDYTFIEAIPAGFNYSINLLSNYIDQFRLVFTVAGMKQLGGFATMSKMFTPYWNWQVFWHSTAFISIILAFMNILPIPALDGGHVMFLLYEMITRRKPNEKIMEYAQVAGMVLLLALMLFANGNDAVRWLFK